MSAENLICVPICIYSSADKAYYRQVEGQESCLKLTSSLDCFKFKGSCLFPLLLNLASWLEFLSVIGDHHLPGLHMELCFAGVGSIDYY